MHIQLILFSMLSTSFAIPKIRQDNNFLNLWLPGINPGQNLKGKFGFGTCPKVNPIEDFDINLMLGTWYVHYHQEPSAAVLKCGKWEVSRPDGETEGNPCHIKVAVSGINVNGQLIQLPTATIFIESDNNELQMIEKMSGYPPIAWYPLHAGDDHLDIHGCEEFPGDDLPIKAFYQHNYLLRRDRKEITPQLVETMREFFNKNGIDFDTFIKMDQQNCEEDFIVDPIG